MSSKRPSEPKWWKNTFFLFGFALAGLAVWGLVSGEAVIRDPGQRKESGLVVFYLVASVVMLLNGWLTHSQSVQAYEELGDDEVAEAASEG